jgi:hypothetical protein
MGNGDSTSKYDGPPPRPVGAQWGPLSDRGEYPDFYRFRLTVLEVPFAWPRQVEVELHHHNLYILGISNFVGARVLCNIPYENIKSWSYSSHELGLSMRLDSQEYQKLKFLTTEARGIVASLHSVAQRILSEKLMQKARNQEKDRMERHLEVVHADLIALEISQFFNGDSGNK